MVINVIVEGGSYGNDPTTSMAANEIVARNSAALRQSLNDFFHRAVKRDDIDIRINVATGKRAVFKQFVTKAIDDFCYVDLDNTPENREMWFEDFGELKYTQVQHDAVFFWIPEMEAWFLKQPSAIELWARNEGLAIKEGASIADDNNIKDRDIERINPKPSRIMDTLFIRYLISPIKGKDGGPKKLKYKKLTHAARIMPFLDAEILKQQDKELSNFVVAVERIKKDPNQ